MDHYNEEDLDKLIDEKLTHCEMYSNLCKFIETPAGRQRAKERIKQIIFETGIANVDTAIATVETELIFED